MIFNGKIVPNEVTPLLSKSTYEDDDMSVHVRDILQPLFKSKGCLGIYSLLCVLSLLIFIWEFAWRDVESLHTEKIRILVDSSVNSLLLLDIFLGFSMFGCKWFNHISNLILLTITLLCIGWMCYDAVELVSSSSQHTSHHHTPFSSKPMLFHSVLMRDFAFSFIYGSRVVLCFFKAGGLVAYFGQEEVGFLDIDDDDIVATTTEDPLLRSFLIEDDDDIRKKRSYSMPDREEAYESVSVTYT